MDYDTARALGNDLKNHGADRFAEVKLQEDAEEFGGGYSVHLHLRSHRLPAGLLDALSACDCGVGFLSEEENPRLFKWLVEPPSEGGD